MDRPTLTVAQVRALAPHWTLAAIRWRFECWERRGWPRVTRVACRRNGGFRRVVDAAELRAVLAGALTSEPVAA